VRFDTSIVIAGRPLTRVTEVASLKVGLICATSDSVTAAPDEERKDRRVEICSACQGYLKTIDVPALSPFPLVAVVDMETMDLDLAAMEHGYGRPPLKEFTPGLKKG